MVQVWIGLGSLPSVATRKAILEAMPGKERPVPFIRNRPETTFTTADGLLDNHVWS